MSCGASPRHRSERWSRHAETSGSFSPFFRYTIGVGLDVVGPPPGAQLPPHVAATMKRMAGNLDLFLAHELLPFTRYVPDLPRLSAHKNRIVLAGGHDSREQLAGQVAYRPAALL